MPPQNARCEEVGSAKPRIQCRYTILLMGFVAEFFLHAHRVTMSVGIDAMVNGSSSADPEQPRSSSSCLHLRENDSHVANRSTKTEEGEFVWEPTDQSYILWSSLACFALAILPAGKIAQSAGCRKVLFGSTFFPSVLTLLTPLSAWCGVGAVVFVQSLRGAAQAGIIPAQALLVSNWFPKSERGFAFTFILTGATWGAGAGHYVARFLTQSSLCGGWPTAFYAIGGTGTFASLLMGYFMHENPRLHPKISQSELRHIIGDRESDLTQKRPDTPWGKVFTSLPVFALAVAYFGQEWALSYSRTVVPVYLSAVLHSPPTQERLFPVLPLSLQIVTSLASGGLSLYFSQRNCMSVDGTRKCWNSVGCVAYSGCLLGIYFSGCNGSAGVAFAILSVACTGFAFAGCCITSTDLSPTFAAPVNATAYFLGVTPNFLVPAIFGLLADDSEGVGEWSRMLFLSVGVVISSGTVFVLFGSAAIQTWDSAGPNAADLASKNPTQQREPASPLERTSGNNFLKDVL